MVDFILVDWLVANAEMVLNVGIPDCITSNMEVSNLSNRISP